MRHLPFNHTWHLISHGQARVPTDYTITDFRIDTFMHQYCFCGKVRTKVIAPFAMTDFQIEEYLAAVYE